MYNYIDFNNKQYVPYIYIFSQWKGEVSEGLPGGWSKVFVTCGNVVFGMLFVIFCGKILLLFVNQKSPWYRIRLSSTTMNIGGIYFPMKNKVKNCFLCHEITFLYNFIYLISQRQSHGRYCYIWSDILVFNIGSEIWCLRSKK